MKKELAKCGKSELSKKPYDSKYDLAWCKKCGLGQAGFYSNIYRFPDEIKSYEELNRITNNN